MARAKDAGATPTKLTAYRAKRDPKKTPEPMGSSKAGTKKTPLPTFVIQEHHARALHWDFRLERDGVLVSWALPKGLPMDPATNHLAVHVEDHPFDYGKFEGTFPRVSTAPVKSPSGITAPTRPRNGAPTRSWSCSTGHGPREVRALSHRGQELDDPPHGPAAREGRPDARTRPPDAGPARASSRRRTPAGPTSSSGTACAPSSTSTADGCGPSPATTRT